MSVVAVGLVPHTVKLVPKSQIAYLAVTDTVRDAFDRLETRELFAATSGGSPRRISADTSRLSRTASSLSRHLSDGSRAAVRTRRMTLGA